MKIPAFSNGLRRAAAFQIALLLAACGTLHKEPQNAQEVDADSVLLVGRIELVPPLKANEQDLKMGTIDPFDAKGVFAGRAVLYLSDDPGAIGEKTMEAVNPLLARTYFLKIPKSSRYITRGSVLMYHRTRMVNQRQVATDSSELVIPAVQLDIRSGDRAIYVGTWRLHRDEFNEVTKAEILDQYGTAAAELRSKYGSRLTLRKALPSLSVRGRAGAVPAR